MMGTKPPEKKSDRDIFAYLEQKIPLINEYLEKILKSDLLDKLLEREGFKHDREALRKGIKEPLLYLYGLGGKRMRGALTLLVMDAFTKNSDNYVEFSAIPEAIHNASLIQDDIEDSSLTRRGKPAVHVKFGEARSFNSSVAAYYLPIVPLEGSEKINEKQKDAIRREYVIDMLKLALGQSLDLEMGGGDISYKMKRTEGNYMEIIANKSGVLMGFAAKVGGIVAGVDKKTLKALEEFGINLGLAFQIHDDVLNISASEVASNKGKVGEDITDGKYTLPMIKAMREAGEQDKKRFFSILGMKTEDEKLIAEAIGIVDKYGGKEKAEKEAAAKSSVAIDIVEKFLPDSEAKTFLKQLATFAVTRTS
ncbi:MAG: polyprenyl synthetase family protein [Candidatus Micrarchaeota archaeon]|nr:polyprenyl synthetase family protein [Candidatus Micrarchaeota archaeon]MDE1846462.1 polyprenyl synthetase family protein [Candidatus Micrarchaeota archaeon]